MQNKLKGQRVKASGNHTIYFAGEPVSPFAKEGIKDLLRCHSYGQPPTAILNKNASDPPNVEAPNSPPTDPVT